VDQEVPRSSRGGGTTNSTPYRILQKELESCWNALPKDGFLYVGAAPNRAAPVDYHSSLMAGFHHLPMELAARKFENSNHESWFNRVKSEESLELGFYRNGRLPDGEELVSQTIEELRKIHVSTWDVQTWISLPLKPGRGKKIKISTNWNGKLGLVKPLVRCSAVAT
jgi:hypothetical protein